MDGDGDQANGMRMQLSGETCENGSGKLASASIEQSASSEENNATGRSVEDAQVQTRLDEVGPPSEPEPRTGFNDRDQLTSFE